MLSCFVMSSLLVAGWKNILHPHHLHVNQTQGSTVSLILTCLGRGRAHFAEASVVTTSLTCGTELKRLSLGPSTGSSLSPKAQILDHQSCHLRGYSLVCAAMPSDRALPRFQRSGSTLQSTISRLFGLWSLLLGFGTPSNFFVDEGLLGTRVQRRRTPHPDLRVGTGRFAQSGRQTRCLVAAGFTCIGKAEHVHISGRVRMLGNLSGHPALQCGMAPILENARDGFGLPTTPII